MTWVVFLSGALSLAGIYAILAMILNYEGGWGGLWDFSVVALLGVGAYTYIIVTVPSGQYDDLLLNPGLPMVVGIVLAGVVTAVVALLIGIPALRLRGEYFFITTFAFAEVMRQMFVVQSDLTRGVAGFSRIERPFDGVVSGTDYRYVLLGIVVIVGIAMYVLMRRIGNSEHGKLLRAMRDNETLVGALGRSTTRLRLTTFVFAGALVGMVAPLYVWYIRSVVPQLFVPDITFTVWVAIIVGGMASFNGPVAGALILVLATEALLLIPTSPDNANVVAASRPLLLGIALMAFLRFRPDGLVPERFAFRPRQKNADRQEAGSGPAEASAGSRVR